MSVLNNEPEVFYSIQGEGKSMGKPAIFVRLSQCNLHCVWCDTPFTWNWEGSKHEHPDKYKREEYQREVSTEDLVNLVAQYPCKRIILTGGEPMIQQDRLIELMTALRSSDNDYIFEIETNGTFEPSKEFETLINQYNVSLKLSNSGDKKGLRIKSESVEYFAGNTKSNFKFVVDNLQDLTEIEELIKEFHIQSNQVILMPQARTREELLNKQSEVIEICKNRGFSFSDRLHIRVYGDKQGV